MRVGWVIFFIILLLVGTGFYVGQGIASYTGAVITDEYSVFDTADSSAGTGVRIAGLVGREEEILVSLDVKDKVLREHSLSLAVLIFVDGVEIGRSTKEVVVPYNSNFITTISVPVSVQGGTELLVRIEGTDSYGVVRIEGMTKVSVQDTLSPVVWWGFGGFFVLLVIIFLIVKHSLTRAQIAKFAQVHSEGLIQVR